VLWRRLYRLVIDGERGDEGVKVVPGGGDGFYGDMGTSLPIDLEPAEIYSR
jgi:hypothetical protein